MCKEKYSPYIPSDYVSIIIHQCCSVRELDYLFDPKDRILFRHVKNSADGLDKKFIVLLEIE